jgi:hypothetical protein
MFGESRPRPVDPEASIPTRRLVVVRAIGPSSPRIGEVESALDAVEPVLDGLDLAAVTRQVAVHHSIDDKADMSRSASSKRA